MNLRHPTTLTRAGLLFAFLFAAAATSSVRAEALQLRPGTNILASGVVLDVGNYAIPCVTDWNGDGKKDLLIGFQTNGMIRVYTNSGTDAKPVYTGFYILQAAGQDIVHPSPGNCGAPAPWVCDYNGDGKRDLLVGDGADGTVWYYRNTNTDAAPKLTYGVQLRAGSSVLSVTNRATPYVYDWDGDGRKDLLCGNGSGYVFFFRNTNTPTSPVYAPGVMLTAAGKTLNLGIRSVVRVFDWDGDGLNDLVCSSDTGVYWCRNTNSNTAPILDARQALRAPVSGSGLVNIQTGGRMRLDLVDWNNDGVMDIIVGNLDGTISYFQGYHFGIRSIIPLAGNSFYLQWDSAPYLSYDVNSTGCLNTTNCVSVSGLPSQGNITRWTNTFQAEQQFYQVRISN